MYPTSHLEDEAYRQGYFSVAGVDEAGRGALAGPVVAAAVILPRGYRSAIINDSKKLSQRQREICATSIFATAIAIGVGIVEAATIDEINILQASLLAMKKALTTLETRPDFIIVDGKQTIDIPISQKAVVSGDAQCLSCAAASIIAKTTRDKLMWDYHRQFPQYGFAENKGYGTTQHRHALRIWGQTSIHRRSFKLKDRLDDVQQNLGIT